MEKKNYTGSVYALIDSNGYVFYIGSTLNKISMRLHAHMFNARSEKPININAVNRIRESNYDIKVLLIDTISIYQNRNNASRILWALEGKWMLHYKNLGIDLCNKVINHTTAYVFKENGKVESLKFA